MSEDFFGRYSKSLAYRVDSLVNCESEPISRIGAIQPFGYFIASRAEDFTIIAVSENFAALIGKSVEEIIGQNLNVVLRVSGFPAIDSASFRKILQKTSHEAEVAVGGESKHLSASFHRTGNNIGVDLEASVASNDYPVSSIQDLVGRLNEVEPLVEISQTVVENIRELAKFDRVMMYRFLEGWDGEVIAESKQSELEPFLHLRYPASDIPEQARKLYYESKYRMILDSSAEAVPVHTIRGIAREELDLSGTALRASSPIHLKYLQNMGVKSSFSVPVKVHGRLWGLISCHHYTDVVRLSPEVRSACDLTAQMFAARVVDSISKRRLQVKNTTLSVTQSLLRSVADGRSPAQAFKDNEQLVLAATNSAGAYVHILGEKVLLGRCPSPSTIQNVLAHIRANDVRATWKTESLKSTLGLRETDVLAAGAFAVPLSLDFEDNLIWFRPEISREIQWGGRPTGIAGLPKTVLEPRASFEKWSESVKDHSAPWTEEDEECAQSLVFSFVQGIFAKATALARAYQELQRVGKAKDEFISLVSHELRTPLGIIIGWVDIMKDQPGSSHEMMDAIRVVDRNAKLQIGLINDLLDASRIVSGKLRIDPKPGLNVTLLLSEVIESLQPTAYAKSIRIDWSRSTDTFVTGDPDRLRQIIWNLLTNALKFTPKGGRVSVRFEKQSSNYVIAISDTGVGIEPQEIGSVFERFVQVGSEKARHPGLGLGLSIVKALTELHGGSVRADSEGLGTGATFTVTLPIYALVDETEDPQVPTAEAKPHSTNELSGLRILIAEDQEDSARALGILVRRFGAEAEVVGDGASALELAKSMKFDLILSDIGMPVMDGYEFIKAWRHLEQGRRVGAVPAIALTAYARPKDRAMALEAGFQNHIAKPVDRVELLACIRSVLRR